MNIFNTLKTEKKLIADPIVVFEELSALIKEPISVIATGFLRIYNQDNSNVLKLYTYSESAGICLIQSTYHELKFLRKIASGYERIDDCVVDVIDVDESMGGWYLSFNDELDQDINGYISYQPFYFLKTELNEFLTKHKIPVPSFITDTKIENVQQNTQQNSKSQINNDDSLKTDGVILKEVEQLKNEITKLNEQLKQAHKEIAELKSQAPILLGKFIKNDPLQLAIQIRNKEWANYDPSSNSQKPKKNGIIADLQRNYNVSSEQLASSIEKVACPIERKK